MIPRETLDRLQQYCQEASAGPWTWKRGTNKLVSQNGTLVMAYDTSKLAYHPTYEDKRFVREASVWMASLVAELRLISDQTAELERLRAFCRRAHTALAGKRYDPKIMDDLAAEANKAAEAGGKS